MAFHTGGDDDPETYYSEKAERLERELHNHRFITRDFLIRIREEIRVVKVRLQSTGSWGASQEQINRLDLIRIHIDDWITADEEKHGKLTAPNTRGTRGPFT